MKNRLLLFCLGLIAVCWCYDRAHTGSLAQAAMPVAPLQVPPPTPKPTPPEDTARYVAWMEKQGKPISDRPHEDVSLRIGDWGFFYHGERPVGSFTPTRDRTALDRSGNVVTESENGDWFALLSTDGLDVASALKRVAWLFDADGLGPADKYGPASQKKISAPSLGTKDGVITFQGWCEAHTDPPYEIRITITATPARAKIVKDHNR